MGWRLAPSSLRDAQAVAVKAEEAEEEMVVTVSASEATSRSNSDLDMAFKVPQALPVDNDALELSLTGEPSAAPAQQANHLQTAVADEFDFDNVPAKPAPALGLSGGSSAQVVQEQVIHPPAWPHASPSKPAAAACSSSGTSSGFTWLQ
eukprot:3692310-Prymnesium_polylepis.1